MSSIQHDAIVQVVRSHIRWCDEMLDEWRLNAACWETRMWDEGRPFGWSREQVRKKLPVPVEINRVGPFVEAMVSSLFIRKPRSKVSVPGVYRAKAGRKPKTRETANEVQAMIDAWLVRASVQAEAMDAYGQALVYGGGAFRLGVDPCDDDEGEHLGDDVLDRVWIEGVPPWEVLIDRNARPGQERYRAHLSLREIDSVRAVFSLPANTRGVALRDFLTGGWHASPGRSSDAHGLDNYVAVLEWYDLGTPKDPPRQRFFLVEGESSLIPLGEELDVPWVHPSGRPAIPIVPIVLTHRPGKPLHGIPAIRKVVQLNKEQNFTASVVLNSARRDAARKVVYREGTLDADAIAALLSDDDWALIGVGGNPAVQDRPLNETILPVQMPQIASSVPASLALLERAWRDVSGMPDNATGKGNKTNTSAREAQLLAMYGERAASQIQAKMQAAIAAVGQVFLACVGAEIRERKMLTFEHRGRTVKLDPASLAIPWEVEIADAGATPVGEDARREQLLGLLQPLQTLARMAFGGGGQPVDPASQIMAQQLLDDLVIAFDLDERYQTAALRERMVEVLNAAQALERKLGMDPAAQQIAGPPPPMGMPGAPPVPPPGPPPAALPVPPSAPPPIAPPEGY